MDSSTNENNGNVVQASRQSSITNNKTTASYQIPWHHDAWRCCSTSCNGCNLANSSPAPFVRPYYTTRRYDHGTRTTSLRMINDYCEKTRGDRTNKNTISLKTMQQLRKNMKMIQYFLTVAYKNNYMYGKILINGFEPLRPFLSFLKWIDLS